MDGCNINLALSIGGGEFKSNEHHGREERPSNCFALFPCQQAGEGDDRVRKRLHSASRSEDSESTETGDAKEARCGVDERVGGRRKKLRLSKEQLAFLEDSFTEHSTLNLVSTRVTLFPVLEN